ncbi:MAG: type III-A CRISPR-associated protein Csm2 [bacterium]
MSRQMFQNPRGGNPQQKRNPEEDWREKLKKSLGNDYIDKALKFDRLDLEDFKEFNDKIKAFIKEKRNVGTSRMRKIYEIIKGAKDQKSLLVSLPMLAYIVGKESDIKERDQIGEIVLLLSDCIYQMKQEEDFKGIQRFAEALVAYHRYFNPRSE